MALVRNDTAFTGPIADLYERYMVPLLFEPYAEDLARRILAADARTLLEVGCGTGVVTRKLLAGLPQAARSTVSDLNEEMLQQARKRLGEESLPGLADGHRRRSILRGRQFRSGLLPVCRDVLSRQAGRLS